MRVLSGYHNTGRESDNVSIDSCPMCNRPWPVAALPLSSLLIAAALALTLAVAGCVPASPPPLAAGTGTLVVALEGFHNDQGTAIVSLFAGPHGFPDEVSASAVTLKAEIHEGQALAIFPGLPYGEYAISVLHDEDGDGKMATGLLGGPREGFGFSGFPDYRFGPPDYATVSFLLVEPQREIIIGMRYETARRQHQEQGRSTESRRPRE